MGERAVEINNAVDKDQNRWNDLKGRVNLEAIKNCSGKFVIDPGNFSKEKIDLIKEIFPIKNKKILDFGSGRGEFSVALAKLGGIVIGIDVGEDLIELSKQIAKINNVKCDFIVGNIRRLPFEDNVFDFVIGTAILHHLSKQGVVDSLSEAYRVLKPGGRALFIEPIENSKLFNFIQNLFPVGKRPSILNKRKWKDYLESVDDRPLSNNELMSARGSFASAEFKYYGLLVRLFRLFPNKKFRSFLEAVDSFLTHKYSPLRMLSQQILVTYEKYNDFSKRKNL